MVRFLSTDCAKGDRAGNSKAPVVIRGQETGYWTPPVISNDSSAEGGVKVNLGGRVTAEGEGLEH